MGHPRETNLPHDMGLPRPEWDFQGRNWQVGRKHVPQELGTGRQGDGKRNFTTGDGTSKVRTGRQGDGKRNLPQEMGHPRETNLPHDMGLPRPELAGRKMGRVIYHMTWDFQGRNGTSKAGTGRLGGNMYHRSWELAGRETGRGIYRRRWDI